MLLPEKFRRLFSNKQIVCIEYMDIDDRDEREIFQRVQLGMALTPAEKLAVIKSARADFVRQLQSTFFKDSSSPLTTLAWDRSRGLDFRCLATVLWCLDRFRQNPSSLANTGSIVQIESWLSAKQQSLSPQFESDVTNGFSFLEAMLSSSDPAITSPFRAIASSKEASRKGQKVSPIEFICISLLVCIWYTRLSIKSMADAITRMRKAVRSEHVDVRMNTRVGGTMITFIKEQVFADDDHDNNNDDQLSSTSKRKNSPVDVARKRKRTEVEALDAPATSRLADMRRITQRYQERTV